MAEPNPIHTPPAACESVALPQANTDQPFPSASTGEQGEEKSDEHRRKDAAARVPSESDLESIAIPPPAEWIAEQSWK